jgi:hypothetical protein
MATRQIPAMSLPGFVVSSKLLNSTFLMVSQAKSHAFTGSDVSYLFLQQSGKTGRALYVHITD